MKLAIDIGNTNIKIGVFNDKELIEHTRCSLNDTFKIIYAVKKYNPRSCIISSTSLDPIHIYQQIKEVSKTEVIIFDHNTPIPITNLYKTPETLGKDRLAAVIGAFSQNSKHNILVIDVGTAITYDIITNNGEYIGGNISAGIDMRFKALNKFTSKLPLVSAKGKRRSIGTDTETAIRCGVLDGIRYEIEGFINYFTEKHPDLLVFLTGGNELDFDERIKKRIFVDNFLVLKGLHEILLEQTQQK